jgi:hypothetical protein
MHEAVDGIKKNLISSALTVVAKEADATLGKFQPIKR